MSEHRKQHIFWVITLSVAVLVPVGLEWTLRLCDYGGDLRLVQSRVIHGAEYYVLNRDVGRRYFTKGKVSVPELHDEPFAKVKPPGTKRIIMLGESTMAGFPFDYNATPPDLLRDRLSAMYPGTRFEVINAGLSAINSYAVCQFAEELASLEPDLYVVYLGHNEFYGALGVGSSQFLSRSGTLVRTYLAILDFRTFRLLRDGLLAVRRWFKPDPAPGDGTLLSAMAREKAIPFGSDEYSLARGTYEDNLRRIVATAKAHQIPIILSTVACNVRDQQPLASAFSENLPAADRVRWESLAARGREAFLAGDFPAALAAFDACIAVDKFQAEGQYGRARTLDTLGRWDEAARAYRLARDYDVLRFRATDDFNDVLRQTCRETGVACADAERAFTLASPHGLTGLNLMLEHLHPNIDGYLLLAKVFAEAVAENDLLHAHAPPAPVDEAALVRAAGITPFEREVARCRVSRLLDNWPFRDQPPGASSYVPRDTVGELAEAYVKKRIPWSEAHYAIAGWYSRHQNFAAAREEYYAVSKVATYSYYPLMQMGDMERLLEHPAQAESLYRLALTKEGSPYVHVRLGMLLFDEGRGQESVREFEETFAAEERSADKMDVQARSMARFFLGAAYGRTGDLQKAKDNLRLAVQIDPRNLEAKSMLAQIP